MPQLSKDISNRSLLYGDFDQDGIPNLDDKYPLNRYKSEQKEEVRLSDELRKIRKKSQEHKMVLGITISELRGKGYKVRGRIKGTNSIVNKLRRRFAYKIQDYAGIVILADSVDEAYQILERLRQEYNVVEVEDFYQAKHRTGNDYKALHAIIERDGKYIEIQIKTVDDFKKAVAGHTKYKTTDVTEG